MAPFNDTQGFDPTRTRHGGVPRTQPIRSGAPLSLLRLRRRIIHVGAGLLVALVAAGIYALSWFVILDLY